MSIYSEDYTAAVETKIEIDEYADDEVNALPQAPRKSSRKTEFLENICLVMEKVGLVHDFL